MPLCRRANILGRTPMAKIQSNPLWNGSSLLKRRVRFQSKIEARESKLSSRCTFSHMQVQAIDNKNLSIMANKQENDCMQGFLDLAAAVFDTQPR